MLLLIFTTTVCIFLVVLQPDWQDIPPHSFLKGLTRKRCSPPPPPLFFYFLSRELWMTFSSHQHQACELFAAKLWSRSIRSVPAWGQQQNHRPFYYFSKGQKQRQLSAERAIRIAEKCQANGCVIYFSRIGKTVPLWPLWLRLEASVYLCVELRRLDMWPTVCWHRRSQSSWFLWDVRRHDSSYVLLSYVKI